MGEAAAKYPFAAGEAARPLRRRRHLVSRFAVEAMASGSSGQGATRQPANAGQKGLHGPGLPGVHAYHIAEERTWDIASSDC